jgi:hypothetical protein
VRLKAKFERFLGQLEKTLGSEDPVKSFLRDLFLCEADQFTHNHSAIATLLDERKAVSCLTTNYDNAIEKAFPDVEDYKFVHPKYSDIASFETNPCLLKLHGDVVLGTYIATLNRLLSAEEAREHEYLRTLLKDRAVLVIGYSGYGDIDIAPHLHYLAENGDTKFVWATYKDGDQPNFANYYFVTDLSKTDPDQNWLLHLADYYGHRRASGSNSPNWKKRVETWFAGVNYELLSDMVRRLLQGEVGWPLLHLHHVTQWWSEHNAEPQDSSQLAFRHGEVK